LSFSGHFVVTVPFSTPQAARRLLAVYPNMSELLAVIALREACAGPLCFHFYHYVVQVCELEKLLRFFVPLQCEKEERRGLCLMASLSLLSRGGHLSYVVYFIS